MTFTMHRSVRSTSVVAAALLVLSFGTAGSALADPGNGNGSGAANGQAAAGNNGNNGNGNNGNGNGNGAAADTGQAAAGNYGDTNSNGSDNGNSGNGNGNGSDNGSAAAASAAASSGGGSAAKSSNGSSAKGSSSKGSSAKGSSSEGSSTKGSSAKGSSGKSSASNGKAADHKTKGTAGTSGNPTQPQPISGADDNSGGANGQCPGGVYCSTRDGSPSLNGQGKGKAVGKPCAGCVGKADNKNPKGQMPGPSDKNAGYECDRNNGIGKTNPAHTGCKSTPPPVCVDQPGKPCTPPPPCVDQPGKPCTPPPPCVDQPGKPCIPPPPPGAECPPGSVLGPNGVCVFGQEEILCPNGSVMPANGKCDHKRPPTVLGQEAFRPRPNAAVSQPQAGVLPATGANDGLGLLAGAGFLMLAIGAGAMLRRRTD
jgi:LPXTG-motif cell wall-anchored protein